MSRETNSIDRQAVEQKVSELIQQSKILETYMNDILTKESALNRLIGEAQLASEALQSLSSDDDVHAMIPLGIGVYVKSTIASVKKLLVNIGAGVTVEKSRTDTINYVESKIKGFELALGQLNGQREQITGRMNQIQNEINGLIQNTSRDK
ncbi:MAG TPA: prefoldin subunit alpha [Nitrososphaeraceae archaeon]|jgi:prefoldin alpha subunit